ncbi:hypothetical protein ACJJIU_10370 [Microbulbifer sp. CnH-101-E]|uniref:hypothetical protein n=1 Tax=unclassified Microbulbifer TaxID=2619833 RepID=UPI00403A776B
MIVKRVFIAAIYTIGTLIMAALAAAGGANVGFVRQENFDQGSFKAFMFCTLGVVLIFLFHWVIRNKTGPSYKSIRKTGERMGVILFAAAFIH